jgi:hypothetical protein
VLACLFQLLDDEEAAVPFDDASGVGVLMSRDNQEAPGMGARRSFGTRTKSVSSV